MAIRFPPAGDRPSWKELVLIFLFAGIVAAVLVWLTWRTMHGEATPIVEEPAKTKSFDGQPSRPSIAQPKE